ncbi:nucleotide-excision repair, DNA incision, 3'-to lesion [Desmophyllum pertusum]|uniref:Nucleotide-excision repair, DNA incision, 3'-to lesion n=1 Tax=Desmophyllum pertusum TaxID=174260 RepID=A0A9X0CXP0_9CNID|nr:nucleotide-excision repair, DNA incision, 3'-to lesion [Desmophyllum pertusum]
MLTFASEKLGWSSSKTDEVLLPVLKQLNDKEKQMKIDQFFQVEFHETRKVKSKRIQRVLNRTFNPSSSDSDGEDEEKNNKKQKKSTDKISEKTTKVKQLQHNKRSHSTERNRNEEEKNDTGVNQAKRAKEENDIGGACSLTVNRCSSRRGRGRGRGKTRGNVNITPVESSNQKACKKLSLESQEKSSARPSSSDNKTETPLDSVRVSGEQTGRKRRGASVNTRGKDSKSFDEQENSTSDSSDSEDNDKNFYAGPKPVSVFRRGRGKERGKGRGRGSGRKRGR